MNNIQVARVVSVVDMLKEGSITVVIPHLYANAKVIVKYTSPYMAGNSGGLVAIPEVGNQVLICKPDGQEEWFYLSTVAVSEGHETIPLPKDELREDSVLPEGIKNYSYVGAPQVILLKSPLGHALRISDAGNENYIDRKIEIESAGKKTGMGHKGKKVSLNDSPEINAVIIQDGSIAPNFIRILENYGQIHQECTGTMRLLTREGDLYIINQDGREIVIHNRATGVNSTNTQADSSPGNITIKSDFGDVIINTKSKYGGIFIKTEGSNAPITIESEQDINIKAAANLYLEGQTVDIVGNSAVNIQGGVVNIN